MRAVDHPRFTAEIGCADGEQRMAANRPCEALVFRHWISGTGFQALVFRHWFSGTEGAFANPQRRLAHWHRNGARSGSLRWAWLAILKKLPRLRSLRSCSAKNSMSSEEGHALTVTAWQERVLVNVCSHFDEYARRGGRKAGHVFARPTALFDKFAFVSKIYRAKKHD